MPEPGVPHIFDTVTLSNFALAGRLDLLVSRYGRNAVITPEVRDEIMEGIVAGYAALRTVEDLLLKKHLHLVSVSSSGKEWTTYRDLLRILAPGEASCISFAQAHGGIVVTDDRTARECCAEHGIGVTGTIGILKACCLDSKLTADEADQILQAMVDQGYYAPVQRISDLLG